MDQEGTVEFKKLVMEKLSFFQYGEHIITFQRKPGPLVLERLRILEAKGRDWDFLGNGIGYQARILQWKYKDGLDKELEFIENGKLLAL